MVRFLPRLIPPIDLAAGDNANVPLHDMDDIRSLTNGELRERLERLGIKHGPITKGTRKLYEHLIAYYQGEIQVSITLPEICQRGPSLALVGKAFPSKSKVQIKGY